nr:inovirus-type Gp2 protein [Pantoea ananatis]
MQHSAHTDTNLNYVQHRTLRRHLRHHQNNLFERHSRLLMLRIDFSYLSGSNLSTQADVYTLVGHITELMQRSTAISHMVGHAWVLEHTESHGYHIHAVFYLNGQKRRKAWPAFELLREIWEKITKGEGLAFRCAPQAYYKVQGERVTTYDDYSSRQDMQYILSYLSKTDQKNGKAIGHWSEVPPPARNGRRRKLAISAQHNAKQ